LISKGIYEMVALMWIISIKRRLRIHLANEEQKCVQYEVDIQTYYR